MVAYLLARSLVPLAFKLALPLVGLGIVYHVGSTYFGAQYLERELAAQTAAQAAWKARKARADAIAHQAGEDAREAQERAVTARHEADRLRAAALEAPPEGRGTICPLDCTLPASGG